MQDLIELNAELDAQVVARVLGRDVTRAELAKAFDRVADKANWKNPIDATVDLNVHEEMALIREAIIFYTGSVATFTALAINRTTDGSVCRYHVKAAGYYLTIGA